MKTVNIGLIGLGKVGSGVVRALVEKAALLRRRTGISFKIIKICDKDLLSRRNVKISRLLLTTNPNDILKNKDIEIVVELIGGINPAKDIVLKAIANKKHIVTANKALLAEYKDVIFKTATKKGISVYFEASVAGGIPIIKALREGLVANQIEAIFGIINGTSNYILSEMTEKGIDFGDALAQAKERGYAEKNPSLDIEGHDSAHKLAILASLAFGFDVRPRHIYVEGISQISNYDIRYAAEFGYVIKLLAIAKKYGRELEVRVHPTLIPNKHPLASVNKNFNAVFVDGDMVGEQLFYGQGAGQQPAASAVVSDLVDLAFDIKNQVSLRVPNIVYEKRIDRIRRQREFKSTYYVRFSAIDKPGVLAKIAKILARHSISIASVRQMERKYARIVPIIMMTHEANERQMMNALAQIDALDVVRKKSVVIRSEKRL